MNENHFLEVIILSGALPEWPYGHVFSPVQPSCHHDDRPTLEESVEHELRFIENESCEGTRYHVLPDTSYAMTIRGIHSLLRRGYGRRQVWIRILREFVCLNWWHKSQREDFFIFVGSAFATITNARPVKLTYGLWCKWFFTESLWAAKHGMRFGFLQAVMSESSPDSNISEYTLAEMNVSVDPG